MPADRSDRRAGVRVRAGRAGVGPQSARDGGWAVQGGEAAGGRGGVSFALLSRDDLVALTGCKRRSGVVAWLRVGLRTGCVRLAEGERHARGGQAWRPQ